MSVLIRRTKTSYIPLGNIHTNIGSEKEKNNTSLLRKAKGLLNQEFDCVIVYKVRFAIFGRLYTPEVSVFLFSREARNTCERKTHLLNARNYRNYRMYR